MLQTENFKLITKQIINKIDNMIPVKWEEVYLYAAVDKKSVKAYFFFKPKGNEKEYTYFADIPKLYNIAKGVFNDNILELFSMLTKLYWEYKRNDLIMWTNITLKYKYKEIVNVDLGYADLNILNDSERKIIWQYKYLGIYPEDESSKEIIDKYLKAN